MFDYYRLRFKVLLPERRPISATSAPIPMLMPVRLRWVCWVAWLVVGLALTVSAYVDLPRGGVISALVQAQIVLFPFSVTLGAGFSERQAWARPFLVALLFGSCALVFLSGLLWPSAALLAFTTGTTLYLYRAASSRIYYANLKKEAMVRVAAEDLQSGVFVPLYTAGVGILIGLVTGWQVVSRGLPEEPGHGRMGVNDVYAMVFASVVCAAILGNVGRLFGEALVSWLARRSRRA